MMPLLIEVIPTSIIKDHVDVPGDKYIANRLLLIAALAEGESVIRNIPDNEDINQLIICLQTFGVAIERTPDSLTIKKSAHNDDININVKDSGTLYRFITVYAALAKHRTVIDGSARIQQRPIIELLEALSDLGVVTSDKNAFPITIEGNGFNGGTTTIDGSVSSQYISALLLAAPYARKDVTIKITGDLVSKEYVDLTVELMAQQGVKVNREDYKTFHIPAGQKYQPVNHTIPSDFSSANYFFALAAILQKKITVNNLERKLPNGEKKFIDILAEMGCIVDKETNTVSAANRLKGITVDMSNIPDSVQTLAAVAVFSEGKTEIKNIAHLKYKESDRIKDTATELRKLGVNVKQTEETLIINGGNCTGGCVKPHNDHRLAMSLAILGTKVAGIRILNPECTRKSFPEFFNTLESVGVKLRRIHSISLIGYRASGKTTVGKALSAAINMRTVSLDEMVAAKVGMTINEFVAHNGWQSFRSIETECLQGLGDCQIIDTGGGVIESPANRKQLKRLSVVVYLKATSETIKARIEQDSANVRPALTGSSAISEIEEILKTRKPIYEATADIIIDVDGKEVTEIVNEIIGNK